MSQADAIILVVVFYVLPFLHVLLSRSAGTFRPPPGARCPFGPRLGWLIMVVLLGPIGWLMFIARQRRRTAGS